MSFYGFILLTLGALQAHSRYVLYRPSEENLHWHPVNHSSLQCPLRGSELYPSPNAGFRASLPHSIGGIKTDGYSCHKTEWVSECTESWYWTSDIKQYVRALPVSHRECNDIIAKKRSGDDETPFFPAPHCQWANTIRQSKTFLKANTKKVTIDPYTSEYVDPIFVGGRCKDPPCQTIQSGVIWLPGLRESTSHMWQEVYLRYAPPNGNMSQLKIWGPGFPITKMESACKMTYITRKVIRFPSGMGVSVDESAFKDQKFKTWLSEMKECEPGTTLKVPNAHESVAEHQVEIDDIVYTLRCMDIVSRFRDTNTISIMDLSFFGPDHEGMGNVYRLRNGFLEATTAHYVKCIRSARDNSALCMDDDDKTIFSPQWVSSGVKGVYSGFNGVYKKDGKIFDAGGHLSENMLQDMDTMRLDIQVIKHPIQLVLKDKYNDTTLFADETGERGNLDIPLFHDLKEIWNKTIHWVAGAGVLVISLIIGTALCRCFKPGKRQKKRGNEHEMREF
ncbi:glycoprotein [Cuiaba virus]|uniref:Glycoprotein n=1 Tax=Cuiaba virus TaxID=2495751 RepID=A0A3Q8TNJ2_9RHAB|nr:glycoprotein [Cuiaba virus]AZL49344.1 glycoprotein [Cuiaba virus]